MNSASLITHGHYRIPYCADSWADLVTKMQLINGQSLWPSCLFGVLFTAVIDTTRSAAQSVMLRQNEMDRSPMCLVAKTKVNKNFAHPRLGWRACT